MRRGMRRALCRADCTTQHRLMFSPPPISLPIPGPAWRCQKAGGECCAPQVHPKVF